MVEGTNMLPVIPMKPMVDTTNDVDLEMELRRGDTYTSWINVRRCWD